MHEDTNLTDVQLNVLHDHYKETFARLKEMEGKRDRLFLGVIGLFALLCLEIGYPADVGGTLGQVTIWGGELNLQSLPLPALLNVTWVLLLAIGLRYCQVTVHVNRQYPYLHLLEEKISPRIGGGNLYRREGKVYLTEYPLLLDVAWFAYGFLFPLIVILAASALIAWEFSRLPYPIYHLIFDAFVGGALILFFILYRIQPTIASGWRRWRSWLRKRRPQA